MCLCVCLSVIVLHAGGVIFEPHAAAGGDAGVQRSGGRLSVRRGCGGVATVPVGGGKVACMLILHDFLFSMLTLIVVVILMCECRWTVTRASETCCRLLRAGASWSPCSMCVSREPWTTRRIRSSLQAMAWCTSPCKAMTLPAPLLSATSRPSARTSRDLSWRHKTTCTSWPL